MMSIAFSTNLIFRFFLLPNVVNGSLLVFPFVVIIVRLLPVVFYLPGFVFCVLLFEQFFWICSWALFPGLPSHRWIVDRFYHYPVLSLVFSSSLIPAKYFSCLSLSEVLTVFVWPSSIFALIFLQRLSVCRLRVGFLFLIHSVVSYCWIWYRNKRYRLPVVILILIGWLLTNAVMVKNSGRMFFVELV